MFDVLFQRSHALTRHRDGPLVESRRRFLAHCANQGMTLSTLRIMAWDLLTIIDWLHLETRGNRLIPLAEVEGAGTRWANPRRRPFRRLQMPIARRRRLLFVAKRWLQFLGRLRLPKTAPRSYAQRVAAFADFQKEKGLSPQTIDCRCRVAQTFLDRLCGTGRRMEDLTPALVDDSLIQHARESDLTRMSLHVYSAFLRAFFRYAETRAWCRKGLAQAIIAPRVYAQESFPAGPSWDDVRRLLATTEGDRPTDIRNRALLMLLVVYGFRSGEVRHLELGDLDWEQELIRIRRTKQGRTRFYPLSQTVGDAIVRYLQEVRPRSLYREVFLTRQAPIRPLGSATLRTMIAPRLQALGILLPHYGPHVLRHACATHLLEQGLSLKEIGDYLGHVCPESTLLYAKVNLPGLRIVADFDLEDLL